MIPRETRQCPERNSDPVGVAEVCRACEWYSPDPRGTRTCKSVKANARMHIAELKRILGGEDDYKE